MTMHPALRDIFRGTRRELTSLLLAGAMLSPVIAALVGWRVQTPLGVPLWMHAVLLLAFGLVAFGVAERGDGAAADRRWLVWLLVPAFAGSFAAIVQERANVFYTQRALVEGMSVLFVLHVGGAVLRSRARRRLDLCSAERAPRVRWRRLGAWRRRLRTRCLPMTPATRLADALTTGVGWLVLASWVLIALEHRHPAGPLLLGAGAMEALALLVRVPDALAGTGWLDSRTAVPPPHGTREDRPTLVDDDAQARPPIGSHLFRSHP